MSSVNPTCLEKVKNFVTSKPFVGVCFVTALAVTVLGALAVISAFLPPQNPLGVLGGAFGVPGAIATLAAGAALFTLIAIALLVSYCRSKSEREVEWKAVNLLSSKTGNNPPIKDKTATGTGSVHPNTRQASKADNVVFE